MEVTERRVVKVKRGSETYYTKNYSTKDGRIVTMAFGIIPYTPTKFVTPDANIIYINTDMNYAGYIGIGYSVCVPGDKFNQELGTNKSIGRVVAARDRSLFIREGINDDMLGLVNKNVLIAEGFLNSAFKKFTKNKLPELNKRKTQYITHEITT